MKKLLEKSIDSFRRPSSGRPTTLLPTQPWPGPTFFSLRVGTHLLLDARAAARRALEIDPGQADAHVVMGFAALQLDWDWAGAEGTTSARSS